MIAATKQRILTNRVSRSGQQCQRGHVKRKTHKLVKRFIFQNDMHLALLEATDATYIIRDNKWAVILGGIITQKRL